MQCIACRPRGLTRQPCGSRARQDYFPAVATTDILARVADVLCCKPSELAFYPVNADSHHSRTAAAAAVVVVLVLLVLLDAPPALIWQVPKLMIRRVGDHEAYSALRASELGDGTLELREVSDAMKYVALMKEGPQLLVQMNECITANAKIGLYDGCKKAVQLATDLAKA